MSEWAEKYARPDGVITWAEKYATPFEGLMGDITTKKGHVVPSEVFHRLIKTESGGNPNATSPKGAAGAAQLMPETAKQYGVKDPYNLRESLTAGRHLLSDLVDKYEGNLEKALAAYNWGQGNVDRKGLDKAPKETKDYLQKTLHEGSEHKPFVLPPALKTLKHEFSDPFLQGEQFKLSEAVEKGRLTNEQINDRAMDWVSPGSGALAGVIKREGGQWLSGTVDKALKPLLRWSARLERAPSHEERIQAIKAARDEYARLELTEDVTRREEQITTLEKENAINKWITGPLRKYVMNRMATPSDEIRGLADQGILHTDPERLLNLSDSEMTLAKARRKAGFPASGNATTEGGSAWESASDTSVNTLSADQVRTSTVHGKGHPPGGDPEYKEDMPWLLKLKPDELVHSLTPNSPTAQAYDLGFDHIVDVLSEKVANGEIRPEQLNKVSVADAVRMTHEVNEAARKALGKTEGTRLESVASHTKSLTPYKSYGGVNWYEFKKGMGPEDIAKGLSADSCILEHCVGGVGHNADGYQGYVPMRDLVTGKKVHEKYPDFNDYAKQVMSGESRIYSLRDKGKPVATIEVSDGQAGYGELPEILQIKGPLNGKPEAKYLPMIQDFVKSGKWGTVDDLQNTDLIQTARLKGGVHPTKAGLPPELYNPSKTSGPQLYDVLKDQSYVSKEDIIKAAQKLLKGK